MTGIQPEKLDDIQLSLYLAQKHYPGQTMTTVLEIADRVLEWIKEKRQEQTEDNKKEIENQIT